MKYAVAIVLDQTIGYLTGQGPFDYTTKHPEAVLHDTREAAEAAKLLHDAGMPKHYPMGHPHAGEDIPTEEIERYSAWVEDVDDEAEFRNREDTW